jgi:two-component system response regulator AtoC
MNNGPLRILLVEDNRIDAMVLQDELRRIESGPGFAITVVSRISEIAPALDQDSFDMVLLDLGLPDGEGLETLEKVRGVVPELPIVVMSGLDDEAVAVEAVRQSAQDYIVKDRWNRQLLVRSLTYALERHRLMVEREQAVQASLESEQRFRAIFEGAQDAIYVKDRSLTFTHINPAMANLFGRKPEELLSATEEHLYGKDTAAQVKTWDMRALEGETIEEEHTRIIYGEPLTFLDTRIPMRNAEGDIVGVCCISRNITDRKRALPQDRIRPTDYPSPAIRKLMKQAERIAKTEGTVLLQGESGSGKDYLARWIHDHSDRRRGPYFAINCAALTQELAESELFGHESGAFTGARGRKKGMLELAEGGTLLLNEIGELPLSLQSKLLTFLDTRSFLRVGGEKSVTVDARLIAATHRELTTELAEGRFLEPLYYRLEVFTIEVPALRERKEDIPILVEEIMTELAAKMHLSHIPVIDQSTLDGLTTYNWPGNVRELKNALERALMLWDGTRLDLRIPSHTTSDEKWSRDLPFPSYWTLREVTDEVIKSMCMEALRRTKGNKKEAATILRISRDALYRYIRRFKIKPELLS